MILLSRCGRCTDRISPVISLEEYAIRAYQERTLGESHLRRLLGFETRDELEEFFAAHHVYRNYKLEDLEKDRRTARQLGL
jgi:hypothetical protein